MLGSAPCYTNTIIRVEQLGFMRSGTAAAASAAASAASSASAAASAAASATGADIVEFIDVPYRIDATPHHCWLMYSRLAEAKASMLHTFQ